MLALHAIDAHLDMLRIEKAQQRRTTELFWVTWWEDVDAELDARLKLMSSLGRTRDDAAS